MEMFFRVFLISLPKNGRTGSRARVKRITTAYANHYTIRPFLARKNIRVLSWGVRKKLLVHKALLRRQRLRAGAFTLWRLELHKQVISPRECNNWFGWCSWLSRQSNTLEVASSILASNTFAKRKKKMCRNRGSNTGPLDLQSNALPTELSQQLA